MPQRTGRLVRYDPATQTEIVNRLLFRWRWQSRLDPTVPHRKGEIMFNSTANAGLFRDAITRAEESDKQAQIGLNPRRGKRSLRIAS